MCSSSVVQPLEGKPVVLVVDDIPECVEMLGAILEDHYTVRLATSGRAALRLAWDGPVPDLVLLDVMMPDMDGHAVLAALRDHPLTHDVPAIFLTSLHEESDELRGLNEGAADFIVKSAAPAVVEARVRTQIELKRMRDRLAQRNRELEQEMRQRVALEHKLQRSLADLEAFSYSISHDLRAPVSAIEAFAGSLREYEGDSLSAKGRHWLERILAGSRRMNGMIDDILACSRAERGAMHLERVDLGALAHDVTEQLRPMYPEAVVTIGELPIVRADPAMMHQVFANLVGNALKFSSKRSGARVRIEASERAGSHDITVSDNGAGFDAAYAAKLFTLFQRLHSDAEFPGTGVGLSIVKRVVERHGGRVAASMQDGWTTFSFELPRQSAAPGSEHFAREIREPRALAAC
ncbi:MAG TPA: ATP-binding protein [Ramlibacter sp.]|uniref:sensor histidine kinase n=1 Tax=Ramlibacter sp. TaxID=1917967 RepID=UPI002CE7BFD0|nr:ATP-binding protein [Ramlibacter sp.]HVZ44383.1 ATP-binding protein [Ramlibacter sp.]